MGIKEAKKIISEIKSVKIQGADNIAKAGIKAYLLDPNEKNLNEIISARPTEPLLQNSLKIISTSQSEKKTAQKIIRFIDSSREKIAQEGAKLIKDGMVIFSHCHSSNVLGILKEAKKQGKTFTVHTLEVEPLLQGRITAKELSKAGIKVTLFPDLAAEQAIKEANLFLFGVDAFTKNGLANKIGTTLLCRLAKRRGIPRYACGNSLKFTKKLKIELRSAKEVWDVKDKNIKIKNPAFDFVPKNLLTGIISEIGILEPKEFIKKSKLTSF